MKKILLLVLTLLALVFGITGCGKIEKNNKNTNEKITMTCTGEKENSNGIELQNIVTYYFNNEQYTTGYSVTTTQKFEDKSLYKEYKSAQEESVSDTSNKDIVYDLKSDDKKLTLVFTMTLKNLNVDDAKTEEEKNNFKASEILNSNESSGYTCIVDGIKKSELK